ncbi:MAG: DUF4276 family protein [Pseudomonadota bacterium]
MEGGGDMTHQKAELRQGLDHLLGEVKSKARAKRFGWKLVCAGGRQKAYDAFINALRTNEDAINVLLVDSESPIAAETGDSARDARERVAHLAARDGWDLEAAPAERIHLMVQCMEAWIVADPEALAHFYGQRFARRSLPARKNLEEDPAPDIYDKLARATRNTQKGEYGKIRHASHLLQRIDATKVAQHCRRFATFTRWLSESIERA